MCYINF
jgi:hypothetical protein